MATTFINDTQSYNIPETFTDPTKVIGSVPNLIDHFANRIVTGNWDFAMDILPGQKLFTSVKFCPYAHANVKTIDTSAAEKMAGVKAVITTLDIPTSASACMVGKNSAGNYEVTYEGQIVAAVAATDPWQAHAAVQAIAVTYDVLPFVSDMDAAMASNAPAAVTGTTPNYRTTTNINKPSKPPTSGPADVDAAMKTADVIIDNTDPKLWFGTGWGSFYSHNTPEPRAATAKWVGDEVWVWQGSQQLASHITNIAKALGLDESKVHLVSHGCGGGYGDRKPNGEEAWIAALLSKKARMPVNCSFSRHVNATGGATHQSQQKAVIKLGCMKDGSIAAVDAQWYGTTGTVALALTYKTDYIRATGTTISINVPRTGPFRSVNGMHSCFVSDQIFDQMAYTLNMDPVDFRMKIAVTPDRIDQSSNLPLGSCVLKEVLQKCSDIFGWKAKWSTLSKPGDSAHLMADGRLRGIGSAYTVSEKGNPSGNRMVLVRVAPDGSTHVNLGIGAAASGTHTAVAVVVAEALGTTIDHVNVTVGEALLSGNGGMQAGSTGTISNCCGAFDAAKQALGQMMTNAAKTLKTTTDQLSSSDGKIFLTSDPTKSVTHAQAVGSNAVIGKGDSSIIGYALKRPVLSWTTGTACQVRTYVAEMVELAVDTETGQIEILNWVMINDMGKAFFPRGAQAQLNGGMAMQYGFVFGWEQLFDPGTGATLNGDFLNQKNPTSADLPIEVMQPIIYESNDASTVYGGKGCGEPPDICYVAIHNAFYNATGKRVNNTLMYPARVLKALGKI
jgi:CO/xanthine dehydrogenase Mo-binding subunit